MSVGPRGQPNYTRRRTHREFRAVRLPSVDGIDPDSWLANKKLFATKAGRRAESRPNTRSRQACRRNAQPRQQRKATQRGRYCPIQCVSGKVPAKRTAAKVGVVGQCSVEAVQRFMRQQARGARTGTLEPSSCPATQAVFLAAGCSGNPCSCERPRLSVSTSERRGACVRLRRRRLVQTAMELQPRAGECTSAAAKRAHRYCSDVKLPNVAGTVPLNRFVRKKLRTSRQGRVVVSQSRGKLHCERGSLEMQRTGT